MLVVRSYYDITRIYLLGYNATLHGLCQDQSREGVEMGEHDTRLLSEDVHEMANSTCSLHR